MDPLQRLMRDVSKDPVTGCWNWTGPVNADGYGRFWHRRRAFFVHRFSYTQAVGEIADGLVLDHLCRNRACVNPAHLEPVSTAENNRRGLGFAGQRHRQTHCIHGHAFVPENTIVRANGTRQCATCNRTTSREYYHRLHPEARRYMGGTYKNR